MDKITLKPSDTITLLRAAIKTQRRVFVGGPKGIGKSMCIEQAATAEGNDLIISQPSAQDPTAPSGIPWPDMASGKVKMLPYGQLGAVLEAVKPTTWLWEDFTHAAPATQIGYFSLALTGECDGHKLPDCVTIVMAGNLRKAGYGTHGILEPMKGRVTLVEMVPNLDDFCNWAYANNQPSEGIAFLRFQPDLLCPEAFDPNYKSAGDFQNDPNPRNWVEAFGWTQQGLSMHIEHAAICGRVGPGPGATFAGWLQMYRNLPSLDYIIMDPDKAEIPGKADVRHAVACGLANKATEKNFDRVERYAQRLYKEGHGDIAVFLCRDAVRRHPKIMTTPTWNQLAPTQLGQLFTGGE